MKHKIKNTSIFVIILCLMMTFLSHTIDAAGTGKAIQLVDSKNPTGGISDQDHIYLGNKVNYYFWAGEALYWRVLDADKTNMNTDGMFLLHESLIGNSSEGFGNISFNSESSMGNNWQGSDAQTWCNEFLAKCFTYVEKDAIMATTKSDSAYTFTKEQNDPSLNFRASENILNNDKIFFLSVEEADNKAYGFTDDDSRRLLFNGTLGNWWLRSPSEDDDDEAGFVYSSGYILSQPVKLGFAARPAFNLDLSSVLFTSAAENGKVSNGTGADALTSVSSYSGKDWKLTLKDSERSEFSASYSSKDGDVITISYSGAITGNNEYISALIVDKNGTITYYGNLLLLSEEDDYSGMVTVNLSGKYNDGDTLYVFNEQCNGNKKTDYSSELKEIVIHDHIYEFEGFTWEGNDTDGYTGAKAVYKCSCGKTTTIVFEEEDIVKETLEPTCEEAGYIKYTATVAAEFAELLGDIQRSDTKTVTIPKLTEGCQITPEPTPSPEVFQVPKTGIE